MANETDRRLVLLDIQVQGLADIQKAARELNLASNEAKKAGQSVESFGTKTKGSLSSMGGFGTVLRNSSAQLQDFSVQVAFGTSALQAFGQQAPQLLSAFGTLGTVAGTVIAIAVALPALVNVFNSVVGAASDAQGTIESFNKAAAQVDKVINGIDATGRSFNMKNVIKSFNEASEAGRTLIITAVEANAALAQMSIMKQKTEALALAANTTKFSILDSFKLERGSMVEPAIQKMAADLGIASSEARKLKKDIEGLNSKSTAQDFADLGNALAKITKSEQGVEFASSLIKTGIAMKDVAEQSTDAAKFITDASTRIKTGFEEINKSTKGGGGGKTGKSAISTTKDEFVEWQKSLQKAMDTAALAPRKIAFLQEQMANLAVAGQTGSDAFKILADALQQLDKNKTLDPFADVRKSAETLDAAPEKIAAVTNELSRLYALGVDNNLTEGLQDFKRTLEESIDPMKAYANSLKDQQVELDKMPEKLAVIQRMLAEGVISPQVADNATAALQNMNDTLTDTEKAIKQVSTTAIGGLFGAIVDGVGQAKRSFGEMAASFLANVTKMIMNKAVEKLMDLLFSSGMLKSVTGALGGFFGGANAKGNVFSNGRVTAFANGGIVTRPTLFPMARGMGLMGEAGAEAIMPLRRGADGKLGVSGGGVVINIFNNGDNEVKTKTSEQSDGTKQIDMYITKVAKDAIFGGGSDKLFRNAFGLSRQAG